MPDMSAQDAREILQTSGAPDPPATTMVRPNGSSAMSRPKGAGVGMKFALVHLSGSRRGETQYFEHPHVILGSDPRADACFPANGHFPVAPLQAEVFQTDCEIRLRNYEPEARTLVNRQPVDEVVLQDKDLIQLGPKGPTLRFRIRPAEYAVCKRLREILQDTRDVAADGRPDGRLAIRTYLSQLAYEISRNASLATQLVVFGLLIVLVGLVGRLVYYNYVTQRAHEQHIVALLKELETSRLSQAELERKTAEERRRMSETLAAHEAETSRLLALLEEQRRKGAPQEEIHALTQRLKTLETERSAAEVLIKRYGPSVCFIYIAYGFVQKGTSDVPSVLLEFTGTGFLVDDKGGVVTNRHIAEPWSMDPRGTAETVKAGLEPKLVKLLAYFPGRPEPYEISLVRFSDQGDVALGQLSPVPKGLIPIPIGRPPPEGISGEALVVLGYPAGVEGVLARMDDKVAVALLKGADHNLGRLVHDIAAQAGIRPLATQGHISDVVPNRIVYDAQTTSGGSGSPVFNSHEELIAVHAAIMTRFGAVGFGVPISRVLELLPSNP